MEPADLAAATRLYEAKIKIRAAEDGFVAVFRRQSRGSGVLSVSTDLVRVVEGF